MRSIYSNAKGIRARRAWRLGLPLFAAVALTAVLLPVTGSAQLQVAPTSSAEPTIVGSAVEGKTLTASTGTWANSPTTFAYRWLRCPESGGAADGSNCGVIPGNTTSAYELAAPDVGFRIRVRVTASNADGSASATSNPTNVVTAAPVTPASGCPTGTGAIKIADLSSPARLLIDGQKALPSTITRSTNNVAVRFHVSACGGRRVEGALLRVTTVPFNQFTIPAEQATGADGWATLNMERLSGFPAARNQQLLVMSARARKSGENVLAGVSTRRVVAFSVRLSG